MKDKATSNLNIDDIVLIVLLFADDMVLLGESPSDLQNKLDLLSEYCNLWSLEVNVSKTKIMVFRKRGRVRPNENWQYNGHQVEVVDTFNYLGTIFSYTGSFRTNIDHLSGKGLKALNILLVKCCKVPLTPKTLCQLFDSFVSSILHYSCEIWGFVQAIELERLHLKFCKRILKVRTTTASAGVYGELGRFPLYVSRYV